MSRSRRTGSSSIWKAGALAAAPLLLLSLVGSTAAAARPASKAAGHAKHARAAAAQKKPLTVALVTDLTGEDAPSRKPFNEGVIAYYKRFQKVAGHKINVKIFDGQYNPAIAPAVFRQALASHPAGIIDFVVSTSTAAAEPVLASGETPCLCVAGPDSWYGPKPYPWAFTANTTVAENAAAYVTALKKVLGGTLKNKRIAMSGDSTAFLSAIGKGVEALVKKDGGSIVNSQFGNTQETSWSGEAANIAQSHPNAVVDLTIGSAEIVQVKALETAGLTKTPIVVFPGLQYTDLTTLKLPNMFLLTTWPYGTPHKSVVYQAAKKFGYLADETSFEFEFGWTQAAVLTHALNQCNACTGKKLETTLEHIKNLKIPGGAAFGPISFSARNHSVNLTQALVTWNTKRGKLSTTLLPAG